MAPRSELWSNIYAQLVDHWLSDLTVADITQRVLSGPLMNQDDTFWTETPPAFYELLEHWIRTTQQDLNDEQRQLLVQLAGTWHCSLGELADIVRVLT